jgi:hypothetical protein
MLMEDQLFPFGRNIRAIGASLCILRFCSKRICGRNMYFELDKLMDVKVFGSRQDRLKEPHEVEVQGFREAEQHFVYHLTF